MNKISKDSMIFKDLVISQNRKGYRFSMDSIILSRLVKTKKDSTIIEIGSGSGIVLLLISKFKEFKEILGVEIQESLFNLLYRNIIENRLKKKIEIVNEDVKNILPDYKGKFDIVISNPPYYPKGAGRINKNLEEMIARHEIKLDLKSLAQCSSDLLKPKGELYLIYLASRLAELISLLKENHIEPKIILPIYSKETSEADLIFMKADKGGKSALRCLPPLILYDKNGRETKDFKDFYSKSDANLAKRYPLLFPFKQSLYA